MAPSQEPAPEDDRGGASPVPPKVSLERARVIVVGGGVTGLATAYHLAKRGARVTLVEKAPVIGKGAGGSSPGYLFHSGESPAAVFPPPGFSTGLAGFGPLSGLSYLRGNLRKVLKGDPSQLEVPLPPLERGVLPWVANFVRLSLTRRDWMLQRWEAIEALVTRSRDDLKALMVEENLSFKINDLGLLTLCRSQEQLETLTAQLAKKGDAAAAAATAAGVEIVQQKAALRLEPGMLGTSKEDRISAGIYTRDFACGDPDSFAATLATHCRENYGVQVLPSSQVMGLVMHPRKNRLLGVRTKEGDNIGGDHVVLCTGAETNTITRSVGVILPLWPARAFSVACHVPPSLRSLAPQRAVIDPTTGLLVSRVANIVRFTSALQLSHEKVTGKEWLITSVLISARKMFPALSSILLDRDQLEIHAGLFCISPDGVPIISGTSIPNLFVNVGHGMNSFATALGSGFVLGELMSGTKMPQYSLNRFRF